MATTVLLRCAHPGCTRAARVINDGGLFCAVPHRSTSAMVREHVKALTVERWAPA